MAESANQLVEHFFWHESANLVAVMTRAFRIRRMDLVENMVQVAMFEAHECVETTRHSRKPCRVDSPRDEESHPGRLASRKNT